ncbi:MAG: hypothetical protein JWN98_2620 [Abditibacteriota bacterium]|nr:hypothetical protein [Abditibacteriota bacterium]
MNLSKPALMTALLCGTTTLLPPKYFARADDAPAQSNANGNAGAIRLAQAPRAGEDPGDILAPNAQANTQPAGQPKAAQNALLPRPTLQAAWALARTYEFGQSRAPLDVIWDALRLSKSDAERLTLSRNLVTLLEPGTGTEARRFACRMLKAYAPPAAVPFVVTALVPLLRDAQLNTYARYALESIESPTALEALRQVVKDAARQADAVPPSALIGCITTLGLRRDTASVADISAFVPHAEPNVAVAAIVALRQIGDKAATEVLLKASESKNLAVQNAAFDALLRLAEVARRNGRSEEAGRLFQMVYTVNTDSPLRPAALRGVLLSQPDKAIGLLHGSLMSSNVDVRAAAQGALPLLITGPGATPTLRTTLLGWMRDNNSGVQSALLTALAQVEPVANDRAWRDAITSALNSPDEVVRLDALNTLAVWGNATHVPALVRLAASSTGAQKSAAQSTLERLRGAGIETALSTLSETRATPAPERAIALRTLGARRSGVAVPVLLRAARDKDESVRVASLLALGDAARDTDWPALLGLLRIAGDRERPALERSMLALANRSDVAQRPQLAAPIAVALRNTPHKDGAVSVVLLRVLGALGADATLDAVRAALAPTQPADVREGALRTLAEWKSPAVLSDLLGLAKSAEKPAWQLLALRGAIRLIGASKENDQVKVARLQNAMTLAQRSDEKKLVLAEAGKVGSSLALQFVAPYLEQAEVQAEAEAAIVAMMGSGYKRSPEAASEREALSRILQSKNERMRKEAADLLKKFGA